MTFVEFFNSREIGPRHLKNDGLLNTRVPHKPVPDYHKAKKTDGTEDLKNNKNKKMSVITRIQGDNLLKKFNIKLAPNETKNLGNTGITIAMHSSGGYIIQQ